MTEVETKQDEKNRQFLEKVAGFRNTLEGREQQFFDAVMAAALDAPVGRVGDQQAEAELPPESEVAALVEKIKAFQRTLPDEEQRVLAALMARGGGAADVQAHGLLWEDWGSGSAYFLYDIRCQVSGGSAARLEFLPVGGWKMGLYRCWSFEGEPAPAGVSPGSWSPGDEGSPTRMN